MRFGRVRVFFAWYDLWIGAYYDTDSGKLFVCPLPCLVLRLQLRSPAC